MISFLRRIFGKKEIEDVESDSAEHISIDNLSSWFNAKSSSYLLNFESDMSKKKEEIVKLLSDLKIFVEQLGLAKVKDKDSSADLKVKNVVMGHRQNYIRLMKNTLINIDIPEDNDIDSLIKFCDDVKESLDSVSRQSQKSYYTVQHLFSDEVLEISKVLKAIDEKIVEVMQLFESKNIKLIDDVKKRIAEILDENDKHLELLSEISTKDNLLKNIESDIKESENKISELNKSDDFLELKKEQKFLKDADDAISRAKKSMIEMVSPFESVLRKHAYLVLDDEKIALGYAQNPVKMLIDDRQLLIYNIFEKIISEIESGEIELDLKKKEKILDKLKSISRHDLEKVMGEYTSYVNRKNELLKNLNNNISLNERRRITRNLEMFLEKKKNVIEELDKLNKVSLEFDIDKKVEQLEKDIYSLFGFRVSVFIKE